SILDIYGRLPPCQALMAEREAVLGHIPKGTSVGRILASSCSVYVLRAVMSCEPAGSNTHACSIESIGAHVQVELKAGAVTALFIINRETRLAGWSISSSPLGDCD